MAKYSIDGTTLTNIADPIRALRGLTGVLTPEQMATNAAAVQTNVTNALAALEEKGVVVPDGASAEELAELIGTIEGGSGGGSVVAAPLKDVNFYDYDGTRLYSYTVAEAAELTELPALPSHDGLICQGWNWSLDDIKAMGRAVDVGAMYITDDGKTRVYITLQEGRTSPMLGCCPNGTVTVDWGDGTTPDVLTGTSVSTVQWTPTHNYAQPGDYMITLTVNGEMGFYGSTSSENYSGILRYSVGGDARNHAYRNAVRKIETGNSVTRIGGAAFYNCYSLANITIPNSVTSIGGAAFYNCYSLANITIPNSVTSIGDNAFFNCYSLAYVTIPNSVTSIGDKAFYYCHSLANITIPNSVTSIGGSAFNNCHSLANITIPNSVTSIGDKAFYYCHSLANITIPNSVTSIGGNAFNNCCSLANITIPNSVTSIGGDAFCYCYSVHFYDFAKHASVPLLYNTGAFTKIAKDCEIRVPAALADEWKAATNWASYANYIVGV